MTTHSKECIAMTEAHAEAVRAWAERWPDACLKCGATGEVADDDPDAGMFGRKPCAECVEEGQCSRCRFQIASSVELESSAFFQQPAVCPSCGWHESGHPDTHKFTALANMGLWRADPDGPFYGGPCLCEQAEMAAREAAVDVADETPTVDLLDMVNLDERGEYER